MSEARNALRASLLATRDLERVRVVIFDTEVELRQPNLGEINAMATDSKKYKSTMAQMLIQYCYVPGTNEKVFDPADEDVLLGLPTGGWMKDFSEAVAKLTGLDMSEAEKNSETQTA